MPRGVPGMILAVLATACQPPLTDATICQRAEECPRGYQCVQGQCVQRAADAGRSDSHALDGPVLDAAAVDGAQPPGDSALLDAQPAVDTSVPVDATADAGTLQDASAQDGAAGDGVQVGTDGPEPVDAASTDQLAADTPAPDLGTSDSMAVDTAVVPDATLEDAVSPDASGGPQDATAGIDTASSPDTWIAEDSATPVDAAGAADSAGLDRSLNRDGFVIWDGPVVELDATIAIPVVKNPSFELNASNPQYWTPYGIQCVPSIHTFGVDSDLRPVHGDRAYGCITPDTDFSGGLWQQVSTLRDGETYQVGVSAYLVQGCPNTQIRARLGVDPLGGVSHTDSGTSWTPWATASSGWQDLRLEFVAKAATATVFLEYELVAYGFNCSDTTEHALFDLVTLTLP